jgi:hypothetical protein
LASRVDRLPIGRHPAVVWNSPGALSPIEAGPTARSLRHPMVLTVGEVGCC